VPQSTDNLTVQFLAWVEAQPRTYADAMDAWRTTCPRLTVWEDALSAGLIRIDRAGKMSESRLTLTRLGREMLAHCGVTPPGHQA
jgi:hypothetical protein